MSKNKIKALHMKLFRVQEPVLLASVYRCCQYRWRVRLGPAMAVEALQFYKNNLNIHFVSNVDGDHVNEIIKLNPETTLFCDCPRLYNTRNINQF
jgi:hypothetical protein